MGWDENKNEMKKEKYKSDWHSCVFNVCFDAKSNQGTHHLNNNT